MINRIYPNNPGGPFSVAFLQRSVLASRSLALAAFLAVSGCSEGEKGPGAGPLAIEDYVGYTVYVNYWAEWCQPCREEIPELNAFQEKHSDTVRVVGVNFDRLTGDTLAGQVKKLAIDFPNLDIDPRAALEVPVPIGLPETFVINKDGRLVSILRGPQTMESLEGALTLAQQPPQTE